MGVNLSCVTYVGLKSMVRPLKFLSTIFDMHTYPTSDVQFIDFISISRYFCTYHIKINIAFAYVEFSDNISNYHQKVRIAPE